MDDITREIFEKGVTSEFWIILSQWLKSQADPEILVTKINLDEIREVQTKIKFVRSIFSYIDEKLTEVEE